MAKEIFIQLAEIFQDGMILQRNKPIRLFGASGKAQKLSVFLNDTLLCKTELAAGDFQIELPAQEAAENMTMLLKNEESESLALRNVDIGEVWIAGGQSNMEFALLCDRDGETVIAGANDDHFRYYEVGKYAFEGEREENLKNGSRWNNWRRFIPEECTHFSAVATYYAMALREKLRVPVGIVACCWGGTSASAWMDEKLLREDSELKVYTDEYDKATAKLNLEKYIKSDYKYRSFMGSEKNVVGAEATMRKEVTAPMKFPMKQIAKLLQLTLRPGPHSENRPGGLYQTMLAKIAGYSAKGVIWYQAENDEHHADLYARLFTKLVACWRSDWQDDLPFLFVQLAPWEQWMAADGKNFPKLRAQQQEVEDTVSGMYMASIMDVGSQYDIHPKVKKPVGDRLALLALDEIYGIKQAYAHAPQITEAVRDGQRITVSFAHAEGGLEAQGSIDSLFALSQNGKTLPVSAKIENSTVVLTCDTLTTDKATLTFAYVPFLVMNLFNQGGLPARPAAPMEV